MSINSVDMIPLSYKIVPWKVLVAHVDMIGKHPDSFEYTHAMYLRVVIHRMFLFWQVWTSLPTKKKKAWMRHSRLNLIKPQRNGRYERWTTAIGHWRPPQASRRKSKICKISSFITSAQTSNSTDLACQQFTGYHNSHKQTGKQIS